MEYPNLLANSTIPPCQTVCHALHYPQVIKITKEELLTIPVNIRMDKETRERLTSVWLRVKSTNTPATQGDVVEMALLLLEAQLDGKTARVSLSPSALIPPIKENPLLSDKK